MLTVGHVNWYTKHVSHQTLFSTLFSIGITVIYVTQLTLTDKYQMYVTVQRLPAVVTRHDNTSVSSGWITTRPVAVLYVYTNTRRMFSSV